MLNQQRVIAYRRRNKLLQGDIVELTTIVNDIEIMYPDMATVIAAKQAEFGEEEFRKLFERLSLQMFDALWVEHLEVMSYTRASVNLRAYGQRDPLVEYRKEGTRLFAEMQQAVLGRIAEVLPRIQPAAVIKEDELMKKQVIAAQKISAGSTSQSYPQPRTVTESLGRNEMVTITNGTETQQLKFKKAESYLSAGWTIVS